MAIACLAPRAGERVLDVGCGAGQTIARAREPRSARRGACWASTSPKRCWRARRSGSRRRARRTSTFLRADAGTHRFAPPPFDGLFSRFGVMFFDDPRAAFAEPARGAGAEVGPPVVRLLAGDGAQPVGAAPAARGAGRAAAAADAAAARRRARAVRVRRSGSRLRRCWPARASAPSTSSRAPWRCTWAARAPSTRRPTT